MQIVFLCPPAGVINGGTKYIYRMAQILSDAGLKIGLYEPEGKRATWFENDLPVLGPGSLDGDSNQYFVIPEDQEKILASVKDWPQHKVLYSQNQFYAAKSIDAPETYADYGVSHILCSSKSIYDHACLRHPTVKPFLVSCSVDRGVFRPHLKQKSIAFMPRKRSIEALYIQDMFRYLNPQYRDWAWTPIQGKGEQETAQMMGEASVFLSLGRLEGFGLTPLEAMSSGCVVAGFTGIGGWEYATDENGFWADEDDFAACLAQLKAAVDLASTSDAAQINLYHTACETTLNLYTPRVFQESVLRAWAEIMKA